MFDIKPSELDNIIENNTHEYFLDIYKDKYHDAIDDLYGQSLIIRSMWPGGSRVGSHRYNTNGDDSRQSFVVLDNEEPICCMYIERLDDNCFYIGAMAVDKEHMGKGIAYIVLSYIVNQFKDDTQLLVRSAVPNNRKPFHEKIAKSSSPSNNGFSVKYMYDINKIKKHKRPEYECLTDFDIWSLTPNLTDKEKYFR